MVIVPGAFADGSGWRAVSGILAKQGYKVSVVQPPLTSLKDDVAAAKRILALQDGPTILVGNDYGGVIITEAGKAENVGGLVYVAAFQPEKGDTVFKLAASNLPVAMKENKVKILADGYSYVLTDAFWDSFAADLSKEDAEFLARSEVFPSNASFSAEMGEPAWKVRKSWALVATEDKMTNPDLERSMAKRAGSKIVEVKASHAVYISKPADVAKLIVEAAETVSK